MATRSWCGQGKKKNSVMTVAVTGVDGKSFYDYFQTESNDESLRPKKKKTFQNSVRLKFCSFRGEMLRKISTF